MPRAEAVRIGVELRKKRIELAEAEDRAPVRRVG
jgi:hypothetical protein